MSIFVMPLLMHLVPLRGPCRRSLYGLR
jgi:hypothetical protein